MEERSNFFECVRFRLADAENRAAQVAQERDGLTRECNELRHELEKIVRSRRWRMSSAIADKVNGIATLPHRVFSSRDRKTHQPYRSPAPHAAQEPSVTPGAVPVLSGGANSPVIEHPDRIDIISYLFYDFDGKVYMNGGAERYIVDLARLITDMGFRVRIIQNAHEPFEIVHGGVPVIGIATGHTDWTHYYEVSGMFNDYCRGSALVISSPLDLACALTVPAVGINHGIGFDNPVDFSILPNSDLLDRYLRHFYALEAVDEAVCVDTNFMNWVQTFDYSMRRKLVYIPNYVDNEAFTPVEKDASRDVVFCFPRRVVEYRGSDFMEQAFKKILARHATGVQLRIVGQLHDANNRQAVEELIRLYPDRVQWTEAQADQMPDHYAESDVVMIPTRHSEGTSLSCIEAMATNNAIIATTIGGLPDLVINDFNGLLIEPSADALEAACERLIARRDEIARLAANGLAVSRAFAKNLWEDRWRKVIRSAVSARADTA